MVAIVCYVHAFEAAIQSSRIGRKQYLASLSPLGAYFGAVRLSSTPFNIHSLFCILWYNMYVNYYISKYATDPARLPPCLHSILENINPKAQPFMAASSCYMSCSM